MLSTSPAIPTLLVRYEDMCASPREILRRVWEFCDVEPVEPSTVVRAKEHHVIGNRMRMSDTIEVRLDDAWRSSLDPDEQRAVLVAAGGMNERLGYD